MHEDGFARGKALVKGIDYLPPEELPNEEYPPLLTTSRTFMQYNAGTMTRHTRASKADPDNFVEMGAGDADKLGLEAGEEVRDVPAVGSSW